MCDFLEEIACHKTFLAHFLEEIARHKTISAHFLEEIGRHKTISAHFLRKSLGWASTHFLEEIAGMAHIKLTLFLRRTHVSVDAHGKAPF